MCKLIFNRYIIQGITIFAAGALQIQGSAVTYPVVGTRTSAFYSDSTILQSPPSEGELYYGQDATYYNQRNNPSYTNIGNGVIKDNVTGLYWQQDMGSKISCTGAMKKVDSLNSISFGGFNDWRIPSIKELYSLILFRGQSGGTNSVIKYIDTAYFKQPLGNTAIGEREIDAQTWSSTQYKGLTMQRDTTVFGVNFIDGRIKGYPKYRPGSTTPSTMYFRMVRGNAAYGKNRFFDNGDGTITDSATGLMWQKADDGKVRDWKSALSYAENLQLANYSDWRLPDAKELQSIIDYTKCPDLTNSPAIDTAYFKTSEILDPNGKTNYPYFWTSTSHLDGNNPYTSAIYIAFGRAQGKMNGVLMDVHGAGAQRSDPKSGDSAQYPQFLGPQGDVRYVYNYVRCVRNALANSTGNRSETSPKSLRSSLLFNSDNSKLIFKLAQPANVSLSVYDIKGACIITVKYGYLSSGDHSCLIPKQISSSGFFIAKLQAGTNILCQTFANTFK